MATPTNPVSAYLRAVADGQKPVPPAEVRATQRKYGFGGKLPKAVVVSLLAAFVTGLVTPKTLSAAPETGREPTAVVAPASIDRTEDAVLAKVRSYRPLPASEGCVVNSLLFEDWMKEQMPDVWTTQMVASVRIGSPTSKPQHHRMVLFQAGKSYYLYDQTYGALPLHDRNATPSDPQAMVASARFVAEAALTSSYNRHNLGSQPARVDKEKVKGDLYLEIQKRLSARRPAAVVEYAGKKVVAFQEGEKMAVYSQSVGTQQGLLKAPMPEEALTQMLASLHGGKGDFKLIAGSLAPTELKPFDASRIIPSGSQVVAFGNNHTSLQQVNYLVSQLPKLKSMGYDTLYLELPKKDTDNPKRLEADYHSAIENLSRIQTPAAQSEAVRMRGMLRLLQAARELKMNITGVDREMKEVTASKGELNVPAEDRVAFYKTYVIGRNEVFANNIKAEGKKGVFYVGRAHIGIKNDPIMADIARDLGADSNYGLKEDLEKAGVSCTTVVLSSKDEVAGLPHPFAKLMEGQGKASIFRVAGGGEMSGDFFLYVPSARLVQENDMAIHALTAPVTVAANKTLAATPQAPTGPGG